jgi:hypothetical protein
MERETKTILKTMAVIVILIPGLYSMYRSGYMAGPPAAVNAPENGACISCY